MYVGTTQVARCVKPADLRWRLGTPTSEDETPEFFLHRFLSTHAGLLRLPLEVFKRPGSQADSDVFSSNTQ